MESLLFMGIDVGTQGTRVVICDEKGNIFSEANESFSFVHEDKTLPSGFFEQSPLTWWNSTQKAISNSLKILDSKGIKPDIIKAVSVDSTSGTIIFLDKNNNPLSNAIMYNDARSQKEADYINSIAVNTITKLGYKFNSSFALNKILWVKLNRPDIFDKTKLIIHAGDFILGKLCGDFGTSDYSNVLKTGYDVESFEWPSYIFENLGLKNNLFQKVTAPGTKIGSITNSCALETGLSQKTIVVSGMTDGCAAQIATGAVSVGTWNTSIGTTLVIKGVTKNIIPDPQGRIYCHRHPEGFWMPGGASNVGGDCLEINFKKEEFEQFNNKIIVDQPSSLIIYPLQKKSERFPINKNPIEGFIIGKPKNRLDLYQGYLEGVGFVEKLAYEILHDLGSEIGDKIYTVGGATKSKPWLKIRSNILDKTLYRPLYSGTQIGMAVVAASKTFYNSISEAAENMIRIDKIINPEPSCVKIYQEKYESFKSEMKKRNYI